jgi:hypothetical protein
MYGTGESLGTEINVPKLLQHVYEVHNRNETWNLLYTPYTYQMH